MRGYMMIWKGMKAQTRRQESRKLPLFTFQQARA
jgi:hypothetical protein